MNTSALRKANLLWPVAVIVGGFLVAPVGTAAAQSPPETFTQTSTFSDHFVGSLFCHDEMYDITADGHFVVHFTYFADTGAVHVEYHDQGRIVAVPVDGTGPTYTGSFEDADSDNLRAVKNGDVLAEVDTDLALAVAHGSDGSLARATTHAQITLNANGDIAVQFEVDDLVCS